MNEQQFEECSLEKATHIEVGGKVYELGNEYTCAHQVFRYSKHSIEVHTATAGWQLIHVGSFQILGIKPLRERKREPIEFEAIVRRSVNLYLGNVPEGIPLGTKFKCVQILEED